MVSAGITTLLLLSKLVSSVPVNRALHATGTDLAQVLSGTSSSVSLCCTQIFVCSTSSHSLCTGKSNIKDKLL